MGNIVMSEVTCAQAPLVEVIPSTQGTVSAIASAHAPFLYFDSAPTFGHVNGIIRVTLEATRDMPTNTEQRVGSDRVVVAHLRMTIPAAQSLKAAIEGALLLANPSPTETKN